MAPTSTRENKDTSRIRDNQRRSRARRKEYLQELELKLRECENLGAGASTELQIAARRVASENRRLRELLALNGVGEGMIEEFLRGSTGLLDEQGCERGGSAGYELERLIGSRRPCCPGGGNGGNGGEKGEREGVRGDDLSVIRRDSFVQEVGRVSSNISNSTSGFDATNEFNQRSMGQRQLRRLLPLIRPNFDAQNSPPIQYHATYISDLNPPVSIQNNENHHFTISYHDIPPNQQVSMASPATPTSGNVNSCDLATDMITSMAGGDPDSVRADLGCFPGVECEVDNQVVFRVMDQYSNSMGLQ